jgi:NTP pyrophosphatase (non-canonical NTP hydrolase)
MFYALMSEIRAFNKSRDWDKYHTPKNLATSVMIEAAELAEKFQWLTPAESWEIEDMGPVAEEVADVFIYLLNLCDKLHIYPDKAVMEKLVKNGKRFPVPKGGMPCSTAAE